MNFLTTPVEGCQAIFFCKLGVQNECPFYQVQSLKKMTVSLLSVLYFLYNVQYVLLNSYLCAFKPNMVSSWNAVAFCRIFFPRDFGILLRFFIHYYKIPKIRANITTAKILSLAALCLYSVATIYLKFGIKEAVLNLRFGIKRFTSWTSIQNGRLKITFFVC